MVRPEILFPGSYPAAVSHIIGIKIVVPVYQRRARPEFQVIGAGFPDAEAHGRRMNIFPAEFLYPAALQPAAWLQGPVPVQRRPQSRLSVHICADFQCSRRRNPDRKDGGFIGRQFQLRVVQPADAPAVCIIRRNRLPRHHRDFPVFQCAPGGVGVKQQSEDKK